MQESLSEKGKTENTFSVQTLFPIPVQHMIANLGLKLCELVTLNCILMPINKNL